MWSEVSFSRSLASTSFSSTVSVVLAMDWSGGSVFLYEFLFCKHPPLFPRPFLKATASPPRNTQDLYAWFCPTLLLSNQLVLTETWYQVTSPIASITNVSSSHDPGYKNQLIIVVKNCGTETWLYLHGKSVGLVTCNSYVINIKGVQCLQ